MADALRRLVELSSQLVQRYEDIVVKDPSRATRIESILKVASYILPGRFGGGHSLSELGYCISSLYTLLNDYIISKHCHSASSINSYPLRQQRLLWLLALLESTEVVMELFGDSIYRDVGKWIIILWMRIVKAIIQCVTVFLYQSHVLTSPAVPSVDRNKVQALPRDLALPPEGQSVAYRGSRTGKVIRSIHGDPSIPYSELPGFLNSDSSTSKAVAKRDTKMQLTLQQLIAEGLHIARPLVHLMSMVLFQQSSWKPWFISLSMDVISLHLHGGMVKFQTTEPSEMLRRRLVLLLYLLRSPFYEGYTKKLLFAFLHYIASHVPLTSWIVEPLAEYIPVWQGIYSYNWMS